MKYFDLHCDTIYEMYERGCSYKKNLLHIDKNKTSSFESYTQVFSVWSDKDKSDEENYRRFFRILKYALSDPDFPPVITEKTQLKNGGAIIGAEDARLLSGNIQRLKALHSAGLRVLTFGWEGVSCICGSHDTDMGLTAFGREIADECARLSVIADVSHLSDKGTKELLSVDGLHLMASHSLSRALCNVSRNLPDDLARGIAEKGGIIGVSLVGSHIASDYEQNGADTEALCLHVKRMLSLAGENAIAIGADFDGTQKLPKEIRDVSDIEKIRDTFVKNGVPNTVSDKIFYTNAYRFFERSMS